MTKTSRLEAMATALVCVSRRWGYDEGLTLSDSDEDGREEGRVGLPQPSGKERG